MQVILSTYIDIIIIKTFLIDSILISAKILVSKGLLLRFFTCGWAVAIKTLAYFLFIIEEYFNIVYINNKHLFFFCKLYFRKKHKFISCNFSSCWKKCVPYSDTDMRMDETQTYQELSAPVPRTELP